MPVTRPMIIEVRRRSEQGITRPFYCRADDGCWYWVKGSDAGRQSLCAEWLAGHMAREFGLPIPEFGQLVVPEELVQDSLIPDINDLGAGITFGSRDINNTRDYQMGDLRKTSQELRARILFFDWLVQNPDRTLGPEGGNPNLRWSDTDDRLWVIDHNVAFDRPFVPSAFFAHHAFARDKQWLVDNGLLAMAAEAADIVKRVGPMIRDIPEPWLYLDAQLTQPFDFALLAMNVLDGKAPSLRLDWGAGV